MRSALRIAASIFCLAAFFSCTKSGEPSQPIPLTEKGRRVYFTNCVACHNMDPHKDGAVGPAIAGSSLDLIRARVMEAKYPEGYKPKRESKAMAPLPHLKNDLEALQAFLAQ